MRMVGWSGLALAGMAVLANPQAAQACAACGCSLNSDWASQGFNVGPGLRLDLRSDYWNQDQLWSGSKALSRSDFAFPASQEVQGKTVNRQTTLGIDYSSSYNWGVAVNLPYLDRNHTTVGEGDTDESGSHTKGIGDAKVLFRYQGLSADNRSGLQFGLKLPTGNFQRSFSSGPAVGSPIDRGLQAGTGTTDALLGIYRNGTLNEKTGYFVQALTQLPLNSRNDFRPGQQLTASLGLRYLDTTVLTPLLQLNLHAEDREHGDAADTANSGLREVSVTPGVDVRLNSHMGGFVFVQLPVYQRAYGLQLLPRSYISAGMHYRF
jgi:hypothetical protein